jgi:hypothetical protein
MFSSGKTVRPTDFALTDPGAVDIWKKVIGFYDQSDKVDAYKYTITEEDIKNVAEPNGGHIFVDSATGDIKSDKYNKMVLENIYKLASSTHFSTTSKQTQEKMKDDTKGKLVELYSLLGAEFDRVLDGYTYDTKTGRLTDTASGRVVAKEDMTTLRRKRDATGNELKFRREL